MLQSTPMAKVTMVLTVDRARVSKHPVLMAVAPVMEAREARVRREFLGVSLMGTRFNHWSAEVAVAFYHLPLIPTFPRAAGRFNFKWVEPLLSMGEFRRTVMMQHLKEQVGVRVAVFGLLLAS